VGKKKTVKNETIKHSAAFEIYYAMGEKRTLPRLHEAIGTGIDSLNKWSRSFKWQERIRERDQVLTEFFEKRNNNQILATRKRFIGTIEAVLDKAVQYHEDGVTIKSTNVKALSAGDIKKLVEAHALLTGEATANLNHSGIPQDTKFIVEFV
jgi:hypothetical protein